MTGQRTKWIKSEKKITRFTPYRYICSKIGTGSILYPTLLAQHYRMFPLTLIPPNQDGEPQLVRDEHSGRQLVRDEHSGRAVAADLRRGPHLLKGHSACQVTWVTPYCSGTLKLVTQIKCGSGSATLKKNTVHVRVVEPTFFRDIQHIR